MFCILMMKNFRIYKQSKMEYLLCGLQDMIFYSLSYLNITINFQEGGNAKNIYNSILEREKLNGMPEEVIEKAIKII